MTNNTWQDPSPGKKKAPKRQIFLLGSVPTGTSSQKSSNATFSSTSTSATLSSSKSFSMKGNDCPGQLHQSSVIEMVDSKIDFKGHSLSNENEELALGHTLKIIHVGANKMVSNAAILENYLSSVETQKEEFQCFQSVNMEGICKGIVLLSQPITVHLNDLNINDGFKTILKSYQKYNLNADNTDCAIETANH